MRPIDRFLWQKDRVRRGSLKILLSLSVALGVAALVSLEAFSTRVSNSIERDTKNLLSADFQIQAWRALPPEVRSAAKALATDGQTILQTDIVTTALYERDGTNQSLTVQVRALEGPYPFYGAWRSDPARSIEDLRAAPSLLVDPSLKARGFKLGDTLRLGKVRARIAGFIAEEPQTVASAFALGPRVVMHQRWALESGLMGPGSRAFHMLLVKSALSEKEFRRAFRARVPDPHWKLVTPDRANRQASAVIERVRGFLSFVALAAVLLGGVGVFMIFRSQFLLKLPQYLTLRCLGLPSRSLVVSSLLQALGVALWGWIAGSTLAYFLESALARYAQSNFGVQLSSVSYAVPVLLGLVVSVVTVLIAVTVPMREVLRVPVSQALREAESHTRALGWKDALFTLGAGLLLVALVGRDLKLVAIFSGSLVAVTAALAFACRLLIGFLEKFHPARPLVLRHALLSFTRKRGSSQLLLICLGLSTFLMAAVLLLGHTLKGQIDVSHKIGIPNFFLIGIADSSREGVRALLPPGAEFLPVTQARLTELQGEPIKENEADPTDSGQFYRVREYMVTRRAHLRDGEAIVAGADLFGAPKAGIVRVSLEKGFAERVKLKVGDGLKIEIAGVALAAEVRSLRRVDWFNLKPNFFIVLDEEDIADAPMDYVGLSFVPKPQVAGLQKKLADRFPEITALDGEALSQRLVRLLNQLAFAILSVSLFSLGSCLFVFIGILVAKRPEKFRELSLWRCLGLGRRKLELVMIGEFCFAGLVAAVASLSAAIGAVSSICRFVLNIPFELPSLGLSLAYLFLLPLFLGIGAWFFITTLFASSAAELFRSAEEL